MKQFNRVRLCTDKFSNEGVGTGDIGYILECYSDGKYEVEFSDSTTGITIALIVVEEKEIELAE